MTLARLIEAVEAGAATMNDFAAAFPSETAYGPTTWGEAYKAYNGSLDAAKRLHDALLPGWEWHLGPSNAKIYPYNGSPLKSWGGMADTPARAWILAILRAMEGRDG